MVEYPRGRLSGPVAYALVACELCYNTKRLSVVTPPITDQTRFPAPGSGGVVTVKRWRHLFGLVVGYGACPAGCPGKVGLKAAGFGP